MNLGLWLLDTLLFGLWLGAEWPRWSALTVLPPLVAVGWWLSASGAIPPIKSQSELIAVLAAVNAVAVWLVICNRRVYRDRLAMILFLRDNHGLPNWWELSDAASGTITYSQHLLGYACLQEPLRRFPPILQLAAARAPSLRALKRSARELKKEVV